LECTRAGRLVFRRGHFVVPLPQLPLQLRPGHAGHRKVDNRTRGPVDVGGRGKTPLARKMTSMKWSDGINYY
jgi:hypothetical protein